MSKKVLINIVRLILVLFIITWGIIVFKLSNQDGVQSGKISGKVIEIVLEIKDKFEAIKDEYKATGKIDFSVEPIKEITDTRIYRWQKITRKFAHYTIYTLGSFIIYLTLTTFEPNGKSRTFKKILITLLLGIGYAITDELHQLFIAQRTPKWFDIGIDSLGVITGILLAIIIVFILTKIIDHIYERRKVND